MFLEKETLISFYSTYVFISVQSLTFGPLVRTRTIQVQTKSKTKINRLTKIHLQLCLNAHRTHHSSYPCQRDPNTFYDPPVRISWGTSSCPVPSYDGTYSKRGRRGRDWYPDVF